jgi:hypothetical protein
VLQDTADVTLELKLRDTVLLRDDESVSDMLEVELGLRDNVAATLKLEDSVADAAVVTDMLELELELRDNVNVVV